MPSLNFPSSSATVLVSIIDTTSWARHFPCESFFDPSVEGLKTIDICSYAFLITHDDGQQKRRLLFDLGIRKDWDNLPPPLVKKFEDLKTELTVEKNVADILSDQDIKLDEIEAIIWSHIHWDHTGNPRTFPASVNLLVGPGVKEKYLPGWPSQPKSNVPEEDIEGREVIELSKNKFSMKIGGFAAIDYFEDGSLYILDAPGHMLGHLNALARTSQDDFIFMAADSVHHGGELRPSIHMPLPESFDDQKSEPTCNQRQVFIDMHPKHSSTTPFLGVKPSFPYDLTAAEDTVRKIQEFDADERVLVVFAHDVSLHDVLEYFPKSANNWKEKGWKQKGTWKFLGQLQEAAGNK